MRYFNLLINVNYDEIQETANKNCNGYGYSGAINRLNDYMFRNMPNGICMQLYRKEDERLFAQFAYDDSMYRNDQAYDIVVDEICNLAGIKKSCFHSDEITMIDFYNNCEESSRREYICVSKAQYVKGAKLVVYDLVNLGFETPDYAFDFDEEIVDTDRKTDYSLYNEDFINEIKNIRSHKNDTGVNGNMAHYIISARSVEAAGDMTKTLMQELIKAKRITCPRMEIVKSMHPLIYRHTYLEDIIENNLGGVVVLDLTEKFGCNVLDYGLACKHIESLIKKYHKKCLFVFTYNMDKPGFAFQLLPNLKKYMLPISLKEGTGNRTSAVKYMKSLINQSEYAKYSNQAKEFMAEFSDDSFTQTDVLEAYDQFEIWCLNKNVYNVYDYNISEDFALDRDENAESAQDKLDSLIGLTEVKQHINKVVITDIAEKERKHRFGKKYQNSCMHMAFLGNPGSAKTTVAKLFAGIAKEKGILKSGAFKVCNGSDFNCMGADIFVQECFKAVKGGVLLIDEAYSIKCDDAVSMLIQEMEEKRDEVIVIFAGYTERMKEFLELNEGLKSRIPHWIDFPDYDVDELTEIFKYMVKDRGFTASEAAVKEAYANFDKAQHVDDFGNGRYVRNLLEDAIMNQSIRIMEGKESAEGIGRRELFSITKEDISTLNDSDLEVKDPYKELEDMIGLTSAKDVIRKSVANMKFKKICMDKGIPKEDASYHMVFTGNPGTAKTSVARLFARILKWEGVLPTANFKELGRADLVGDHVGQTAKLVKKCFKEAQGGVLFIDEAYSLCDGYKGSYGDEAINTIVQEMENHRDDTIVIFAGYPEPMKEFLERNPGMSSRISFHVDFDDYSKEELRDIAKLIVKQRKRTITPKALNKLCKNIENAMQSSDFGNGRYVRKLIDEAEMNISNRVNALKVSEITEKMITTIEECDIPDIEEQKTVNVKTIGFCA
ncbi:MAG: AAA family ATPase [Lachnospiraceae bacterium]|nr:AAA family ATPase [Lachnospiraceae bacterium]